MSESRSTLDESGGTDAGVAPPEFRAPAETHVGRVRFQVSDLDRSVGFYRDVLGFEVIASSDAQVSLGVAEPGGKASEGAPLIELLERPGAKPVSPGGRLGLFHVAILLPERAQLGRVLVHLSRAGVRLGASDHRVSEALYLSDPDGLGLEIYADRPRDAWPRSGREIGMATDPLDANGLADAGAREAWDGMPAGTTVGHVHLSVDDLAAAETLFHRGLGLDKVVWTYPGALFLSAGGYHHHLGLNTWARGAPPAAEDECRLLEWRLVFPDAAAVSAALASVADAGFADAVDRTGARVTDPWGVAVKLDTDG